MKRLPDARDPQGAVFAALASDVRRAILDVLVARPGCSVAEVTAHFDISRIAILKHLAVLQEAGLVLSQKTGRTRALWFNAVPIQAIHERWTTQFSAQWAGYVTGVKARVEAAEKDRRRNAKRAAKKQGAQQRG